MKWIDIWKKNCEEQIEIWKKIGEEERLKEKT